jgi:sugar phosphate isomerase/epimerase
MSFTRCFSTLGCPDFRLDEAIALATKHGVGALEIRALGGTIELPAYLASEFGSPAKLAGHLRGQSVRIVAQDASLHLIGATAAEREELLALAPWAEALGVRWLRVFDGGTSANAAEIGAAQETLQWWRETRERRAWAVDVMVETHDSLFTADAIGRLGAAAPGTAMLWDSHHTWKRGGEDPLTTWRTIKGQVVHVHIKDSVSSAGAPGGFQYALPGAGEFPFAPLRAELLAEFSGAVSLEWEKLWHPDLPSLDLALASATHRGWW